MSEREAHPMSKAREAAARALQAEADRFHRPVEYYITGEAAYRAGRQAEAEGRDAVEAAEEWISDKGEIASYAFLSNAAIDAFLASLCEDEDMVERVANAIYDAAPLIRCWPSLVYGRPANTETWNKYASWSEVCADAAIGGDECKRAMNSTRERARAAIATLKQEAGQ